MSTKENILAALSATDEFISGEALSQQCGISRTAVWKHIQKLQEEGYEIESQRRLGYRLISSEDVFTAQEISRYLPEPFLGTKGQIIYYDAVDSTNQEARRLILQGCGQGTVIVANMQTAGKGRLGRHWESPAGTGIWSSLILEPEVGLQQTSLYSFVIAVAVAEGIGEATGLRAEIKWPNDILIGGKKVCGILLELVAEMMQVHQLIVGIGINANQQLEDFPPEVQLKGTSLAIALGHSVNRSAVLGTVLTKVQEACLLLEQEGCAAIREKWIALSCVIGKEVQIMRQGKALLTGVVEGLGSDGALLVQTEHGLEEIIAGDVSLRAADGSYFTQS